MSTTTVHLRWIEKRDAVCPVCLSLGHLEYQEGSWDHRCSRTSNIWTWKEYREEVRALVAHYA